MTKGIAKPKIPAREDRRSMFDLVVCSSERHWSTLFSCSMFITTSVEVLSDWWSAEENLLPVELEKGVEVCRKFWGLTIYDQSSSIFIATSDCWSAEENSLPVELVKRVEVCRNLWGLTTYDEFSSIFITASDCWCAKENLLPGELEKGVEVCGTLWVVTSSDQSSSIFITMSEQFLSGFL